MRIDALAPALQSKLNIDAEVSRLEGIVDVYFPGASADDTALSLLFDPPLSLFQLLQCLHEWGCALATQDLHNRMLAAQDAVLSDLKSKLAAVRRTLPTLRQAAPEQRAQFFSALDQLHFDTIEFRKAMDCDANHPALRLPRAASGGPLSVSCCTATPAADSVVPSSQPRSWWSALTCSAEVPPPRPESIIIPSTVAGSLAAARAKSLHNRVMIRHIISELDNMRTAMDTQFPSEYSSGIKARAARAVDAMLSWAQKVTVVFEPEKNTARLRIPANNTMTQYD